MTLRFVGDVALGRESGWRMSAPHLPMVMNIEGPVLASATAARELVQPYSTREALEACFGSSMAVACLANNHAADLGAEGLAETITHLEALGATVVGTPYGGRPLCSVITHDAQRIGVLACVADESFGTADKAAQAAPYVYRLHEPTLREAVRAARLQADRVVVLLQIGRAHV
jgi:poly-gamma-glutamate capsule biosynthesis protein CapA/YwtB (metallophosphatase superfamily)